jgi:hypothetical protein
MTTFGSATGFSWLLDPLASEGHLYSARNSLARGKRLDDAAVTTRCCTSDNCRSIGGNTRSFVNTV